MSTKRATAGRYTRVGEKKGSLIIGGAEKKMAEDPTFTYVPLFRVAGTKKDVETWLSENQPDRAKEAMKGCYNTTTLKSKAVREAYESELTRASEMRAAVNSSKTETEQVNLLVLKKLLKIFDEQRRNGVDVNTVTSTKTVSDLKEKVKALESEQKVLDVTNMKSKGTDSKKMVFKENSNKRRLSQQESDPFYHVVYNPKSKNSVTGVKNFLKLHGGFETERINKIAEAVGEGTVINISKGKSPTRSPLLSPSRQKKGRKTQKKDVEEFLDEL